MTAVEAALIARAGLTGPATHLAAVAACLPCPARQGGDDHAVCAGLA